MRKVNKEYVDSLINKVLKETLEERADDLMSKIKTNVNELGGMDSDHPKFGKMNFSKMSPEEIEDLMNGYVDSEEDDDDFGYSTHSGDFDGDDSDEDDWTEIDSELEEGFDDPYIQRARGGRDFSRREFKDIPKGSEINMNNFRDDSITPSKFLGNKLNDIDDLFRKHFGKEDDDDYDFNYGDDDDDLVMEQEACEQCGGKLTEGECTECGMKGSYSSMEEGIYDEEDLDDDNEFDYVQEESDIKDYGIKGEPNPEGCRAIMDTIRKYGETEVERDALERYQCDSIKKMETKESLRGRQRVLDRNKNNKIDAEDFKMLRGKKTETKESLKGNQTKLDKNKNNKIDAEDFKMLRGKKTVKESVQLTEDELVDLIENIIKEEQKLKNLGGKPKGLSKYEQVHDKDGKQNDEYLRSVATKMKEYLKDGSKGEYNESPKHFPKGNGQLEKMKANKYTMSDDGNEFLNSYMRPGMEDLVPEEIEYDEDWVSDNIEGSSKTGNNPEWANAEETDLGKNINKKRKDKKFHKAKETAYRKTKVPVSDGTGENSGSGLNIKLESTGKEGKILNEEFNKIKNLMNYDRKTQ